MVGDDLIVRHMDFPGADVLADRLAASNPLSQIDEKSDIPPQAQMTIKGLQQQVQQMQQVIQQLQNELKFKTGIEKMKQDGETQRAHMNAIVKAHDTESWVAEERNQTDKDNQTKKEIAEIQAHVAILLARIDERKEQSKTESSAKVAAET
jgi:hypothetical protein